MRLSEGELRDGYQAYTSRTSQATIGLPDRRRTGRGRFRRIESGGARSRRGPPDRVLGLRAGIPAPARVELECRRGRARRQSVGRRRIPNAARSRRWFEVRPARAPLALAASVLIAIALGVAVVALGWQTRRLAGELAGKDRALTEARQRLTDAGQQAADAQTQLARVREGLEALSKPQLNVPIVDLDPGDAFRGPERARKTINVPADAGSVTLILNVVGDLSYPRYGLEIVDRRDVSCGRVMVSSRAPSTRLRSRSRVRSSAPAPIASSCSGSVSRDDGSSRTTR